MIRHAAALVALLLLAGCGTAPPEDLTAHYSRDSGDGPVVVRAAANGDSRTEAGGTVYIRSNGQEYVVLRDPAGSFATRAEDLLALAAEQAGQDKVFAGLRTQPDYALSEGEATMVAGENGTLWNVHPAEVESLAPIDAVVSADPRLAAIGKGLALQARVSITRNSAPIGGVGNLEKAMIELFDKGAVLRFGTILKLEKIEKGAVPASAFAVPKPLLDRAQLKARLGAPLPPPPPPPPVAEEDGNAAVDLNAAAEAE